METENKTTDAKVLALIEMVRKQKAAIAEAERPHYKTNRTFSFMDGDLTKSINLGTVQELSSLVKMASWVRLQETNYRSAAKEVLGDEVGLVLGKDFTYCGFSADDWVHDLRLKASQLRLKVQKERLAALEERLDRVISPELRRQMEMEAIEAELAKS